ncbi:MAG TPA: COX15/CtaA family protein [Gemmatimonadaceae bacterium]|jgi:cytochrome c oxidase assembly protein subunit 15
MTGKNTRALILWLDATVVAVTLAVVIGGITRLTESGLSITEWKPVSGVLPPRGDVDWARAFAAFLQIPQAQTVHAGITLAQFKFIYWWEWTHRLLARGVGLVIAVPYVWHLARGHIPSYLRLRLALLPILVAAQGALGWYMVSSGLVERSNVSQYRLAAHLGLALVILVIALWTSASLRRPFAKAEKTDRRWVHIGDGFAIWIFAVILSGAFVAGLRAGAIYNAFPLMGGQIVPPGYWALDGFWANAFDNPVAAQFHHRIVATLTVFVAVGLWFAATLTEAPERVVKAQRDVAIIACLQVALGITTLLYAVPVAIAALHQLTAVALLGAAVMAAHTARTAHRR